MVEKLLKREGHVRRVMFYFLADSLVTDDYLEITLSGTHRVVAIATEGRPALGQYCDQFKLQFFDPGSHWWAPVNDEFNDQRVIMHQTRCNDSESIVRKS